MATTQADKTPASGTAKSKGKGKLLLIGVMVLVLILAGGGTWYMLRGHNAKAGATTAKVAPVPPAPPVFFKLEPFTVNLQSDAMGNQLLYVRITLQVADQKTTDYLKSHLPQVRNRLLMVLSGQEADTLISGNGKAQLAQVILSALNKTLAKATPPTKVKRVLFTQFIVQ